MMRCCQSFKILRNGSKCRDHGLLGVGGFSYLLIGSSQDIRTIPFATPGALMQFGPSFATGERPPNERVGLEALELLERTDPGVVIVKMKHKAHGDQIVAPMVDE